MSALPSDFDPSSLTLREATEDEKIQSWRNNSEAWKGRLTVEEYIGQQALNGNQELTRDGGIRYWIFTDATEAGEIYCSAETLRKTVAVRTTRDGSNGGDGGEEFSLEESYGVAGVFTPPKYRRRGIASAMMRRLAAWLDNSDKPCRFSVLWSAVGGFYERFGWAVFPTQEALIPVPHSPAHIPSSNSNPNLPRGGTFLQREALVPMIDSDVAAVISNVQHNPSLLPSGKQTLVAFVPSNAQAKWYFASEEYVATKLFDEPSRTPVRKGAASSTGRVWSYWLHDYNAGKLALLRLVLPTVETESDKAHFITQVSQVLDAARSEAACWGLKTVSIWDPSPLVLAACETMLGVRPEILEEIQGNIPCLRWKGSGGGQCKVEKGVAWIPREMYPWC